MRDSLHIPEDMLLATKRGAAFLDEHHPGWAVAIDQVALDLGSTESCVLGQLYGEYDAGLVATGEPDQWELGFNLLSRRPWSWRKLTAAWLREIRARL